ncbi:MAG TPA: carboxymuconolactone decarboxylase family protein, partial [Acidimicrobiales bacterium]|nr:carboxymuconolactone decarboxylase family protein [Acidimicrobiales bacterium]
MAVSPRVAMLSVEEARAAAAEVGVPAQLAELNFFRLLLRRPATAKAASDLLLSLLAGSALAHRHRELAIMRVGWLTGSAYEWTQHWRIAGQFGLPEADVLATRDWRQHAAFDASDRAVLGAVDEVVESGVARAETWAACTSLLGPDATIELAMAI